MVEGITVQKTEEQLTSSFLVEFRAKVENPSRVRCVQEKYCIVLYCIVYFVYGIYIFCGQNTWYLVQIDKKGVKKQEEWNSVSEAEKIRLHTTYITLSVHCSLYIFVL